MHFCRRKIFSKSGEMPLLVFERHMPVGCCMDHTSGCSVTSHNIYEVLKIFFINKCGINPRRVYQSTTALKL